MPYATWRAADVFVGCAQAHGDVDRLTARPLDPYATYCRAYLQCRAAACAGLPN